MIEIDVGEFAAKLSKWIRVAKDGDVVHVTQNGEVIATLGPPTTMRTASPREPLMARGIVMPDAPPSPGLRPRAGSKQRG